MIGSNHFYLSIKATSDYLLKVLLRCISCIIIDVFKVEQLLIYQRSATVVIKVLQFLLLNCYHLHYIYMKFMNIIMVLLMIYCHHCNMLNQSCATEWIASDIFQVLLLTYNIFYAYLYGYVHGAAMTHSKFYCQWIQSIKSVAIDIFLVLLLIFSYYCYYYIYSNFHQIY